MELKQADSLLANASRLIRATVMLEALRRDGAQLPQVAQLKAFTDETGRTLAAIVSALREDRPIDLPMLRPYERRLCAALTPMTDNDDNVALAVADACDRIADSVDTLAHLVRRAGRQRASTATVTVAG